jgi:hypothetical protein
MDLANKNIYSITESKNHLLPNFYKNFRFIRRILVIENEENPAEA